VWKEVVGNWWLSISSRIGNDQTDDADHQQKFVYSRCETIEKGQAMKQHIVVVLPKTWIGWVFYRDILPVRLWL